MTIIDIARSLKEYVHTPLTRSVLLGILRRYKRPNDKISELIDQGILVMLRRGMYVPGATLGLPVPEPFLIANQLRGPSYVSLESALSYWGFIPERTYEVSSVTVKTSKKYTTAIGRFAYQYLPTPYYSFGIRTVQLSTDQYALIASPEKAICDKIVLTPQINLRSIKQAKAYLLQDLRIDAHDLHTLDRETLASWLDDAPKKNSIKMLLSTLKEL